MESVSVKTYANLMDVSERTVRRYISMSTIIFFTDTVKNRVLVSMTEVKKNSLIPLSTADIDLIMKADDGDAAAQNDLALLFLEHSKPSMAMYWLTLAAKQNNSDAMQLLGDCYATGHGVEKDINEAILWVSKAATLGSVLALKQIKGFFLH